MQPRPLKPETATEVSAEEIDGPRYDRSAVEIFFDPKAPAGHRGADGNRIMLIQPKVSFAFTWNAPEKFPFARDQHTYVMLHFYPVSDSETRVV